LLQPGIGVSHQKRQLGVGRIDLLNLFEQLEGFVIVAEADLPARGIQQRLGLGVALGLLRLFGKNVAERDDPGIGFIDLERLLRCRDRRLEVTLAPRSPPAG
jgi:hypothetical protein